MGLGIWLKKNTCQWVKGQGHGSVVECFALAYGRPWFNLRYNKQMNKGNANLKCLL